jgi:glycine oxidase
MHVIVIGAGIWGLSCAFACAKQGNRVTVYDSEPPGCGASGGIVGAMTPLVPDDWHVKKQFQFDALDSAAQFWTEVDETSKLPSGYGRIGRFQPLITEKAANLADQRALCAATLWQGKYHWSVESCPSYLPASAAPYGVVYDTLSARIFPSQATASLARACASLGVAFKIGHTVDNVSNYQISGTWGTAMADAVIIAAGVTGFALTGLNQPQALGTGVKGQAALLALNLTARPQIYADGIYIIPHINGTVAVGSTTETIWQDCTATDHQLDDLILRATAIYPELQRAAVLTRWAGIRPKARRRDPILGAITGLEGVFCALGAYKIGFGIAHKIGDVLAEMISGAQVSIPKSYTLEWHMQL